jgi:hypothetical protein
VKQNGATILHAEFSSETAEMPHVAVRTVGDPDMAPGVIE